MTDDPDPDKPESPEKKSPLKNPGSGKLRPEIPVPEKLLPLLDKEHALPKGNIVQVKADEQRGREGAAPRTFPYHVIGPLNAAGVESFLTQERETEFNRSVLPAADREGLKNQLENILEPIKGDAGRAFFVLNEKNQLTEIYYGRIVATNSSKKPRLRLEIFERSVYDPGQAKPYYQGKSDKPIATALLNRSDYEIADPKNLLDHLEKYKGGKPQKWPIRTNSKYAVSSRVAGPGDETAPKNYNVVDPVSPQQFMNMNAYATLSDQPPNIKGKVNSLLSDLQKKEYTDVRVVAVLGRQDSANASAEFITTNLYIGGKNKEGRERWTTIDCVPKEGAVVEIIDCGHLPVPKKYFSTKDAVEKFINAIGSLPREGRLSLAPQKEDPLALALAQYKNPAYQPAAREDYRSPQPGIAKEKTSGNLTPGGSTFLG